MIKPEFFLHEGLYDLEQSTTLPIRLAFAGLWTQCDREGRFPWRPRSLKALVLPYDDGVDFAAILQALAKNGFVVPYEFDGNTYGFIPTWQKHQAINNREQGSALPPPTDEMISAAHKQLNLPIPPTRGARVNDASATRGARVNDASATRGAHVDDASSTREARHLVQVQGEGKGREGITTSAELRVVVTALPLIGGGEFGVTTAIIAEFQSAFPAVLVEQEVLKMRSWLISNPKNQKTRSGIMRFMHNWLTKAQNSARTPAAQARGGARPADDVLDAKRARAGRNSS